MLIHLQDPPKCGLDKIWDFFKSRRREFEKELQNWLEPAQPLLQLCDCRGVSPWRPQEIDTANKQEKGPFVISRRRGY